MEVVILGANPRARQIDFAPYRKKEEKMARKVVGPPEVKERPKRPEKVTVQRIYFGEWGGKEPPVGESTGPGPRKRRPRRR